MKHATTRMLFAYWDALRAERAAPERGDVQPGGMRHVLADAFILARIDDGETIFRLAGTRLGSLFGRELTRTPFRRLWSDEEAQEGERIAGIVSGDTVGVVAGLLAWNENGSELPLEMVVLPLRYRGRTETRLLGAISPASLPSWAGLVPLRHVTVTSLRIIDDRRQPIPRPPMPGPPAADPRRGLFIVHEGGRS